MPSGGRIIKWGWELYCRHSSYSESYQLSVQQKIPVNTPLSRQTVTPLHWLGSYHIQNSLTCALSILDLVSSSRPVRFIGPLRIHTSPNPTPAESSQTKSLTCFKHQQQNKEDNNSNNNKNDNNNNNNTIYYQRQRDGALKAIDGSCPVPCIALGIVERGCRRGTLSSVRSMHPQQISLVDDVLMIE